MSNIKNSFTINDLENFTNIKAHTIRIWEKRYNLLSPDRTASGIRYYNTENLKKIPSDKRMYEQVMTKFRTDEVKSFFTKTLMDDLVLENNKITIIKPFDIKVEFELVQEGDDKLIEGMEDIQVDDNATAEIFWLTKVMGDYNIQKYGDNFLFTNESKTMVLKLKDTK